MFAQLLLLASLSTPSSAAALAGVTLPDTATVGGAPLVLNGLGLREKLYVDVYVGGLYLPVKTTNAQTAIDQDVAKRIQMTFIYSKVTREDMSTTFKEGLAKLSNATALQAQFTQLDGMMQDVAAGQVVTIDYVPGTGTTFTFNGTKKGTIAGVDFMRAIWTIYLGPNPPTSNLKKGMLGT